MPKSHPNILFNCMTFTIYDKGYRWNKVVFTVIGGDLRVQSYYIIRRMNIQQALIT